MQEQQHTVAELAAAKQQAAASEQRLQSEATLREEELSREIIDLKEQVAVVLEYKAKRQYVEDEVAGLRQEIDRLRGELALQVTRTLNGTRWDFALVTADVLNPCCTGKGP